MDKARKHHQNIETCKGVAREDPNTRTCKLCVALNHTLFKKKNQPGFAHSYCKCEKPEVDLKKVTLDFPMKKITQYLLIHPSKSKLFSSWGYTMENAQEVYDQIARHAEAGYQSGNYVLGRLNENGQRIEIKCTIPGKGDKANQTYSFITGWMVYPNGKLHNNTPYARDDFKEAT